MFQQQEYAIKSEIASYSIRNYCICWTMMSDICKNDEKKKKTRNFCGHYDWLGALFMVSYACQNMVGLIKPTVKLLNIRIFLKIFSSQVFRVIIWSRNSVLFSVSVNVLRASFFHFERINRCPPQAPHYIIGTTAGACLGLRRRFRPLTDRPGHLAMWKHEHTHHITATGQ